MLLFLFALRLPEWITSISIDGIPFSSFRSSTFNYSISIPPRKQTVKILATSNSPDSIISLSSRFSRFSLSEEIPLFEAITNLFLSTRDQLYLLTFKRSPYSTSIYSLPRRQILTPSPSDDSSPQINCARVTGSRPGNPFLFYLATTGAGQISYSAINLPTTLLLNSNGVINGTTPPEGLYPVTITATNSFGSDQITLIIRSGTRVRLTPPIGWNSWYAQGEGISSSVIRNMTDAVLYHDLHNFGFTYINIDDCWQGVRSATVPYRPTGKRPFSVNNVYFDGFQDLSSVTAYIHSRGLKAGIYSGPKISSYAGFTGSSSFNLTGQDIPFYSPANGNPNSPGPVFDPSGNGTGTDGNPGVWQPTQFFGRWFDGYESSPGGQIGSYWFGRIDTTQFAEWGFDYIKWDWLLYKNVTLTRILTQELADSILENKRDIVLSLSNQVQDQSLMIALPGLGADVARISSDISDNWESVSLAAITALEFLGAGGQGFWPDPDMLQIGYLGNGGLSMKFHKTELSEDAQYFQVSFWAILPAPLLFSGDLNQLDDLTLGLLRNREVMLINQDSLGRFAKKIGGVKEVLAKELDDGTVAIGLFNYDLWDVVQEFRFQDVMDVMGIDLSNGATVRSVWEQKDLGVYENGFAMNLNACTGTLLKLIPVK